MSYPKTYERKIHVSNFAFKELHKHMDRLMDVLMKDDSSDPVKIDLTKRQKAGVILYTHNSEKYLTITYEDDEGTVDATRTINLTSEEARAFAKRFEDILEVIDYKECFQNAVCDDLNKGDGELAEGATPKTVEAYVVKEKGQFTSAVCFITDEAAEEMRACRQPGEEVVKKKLDQPPRCQVVEDVLRKHMELQADRMQVDMSPDVLKSIDRRQLAAVVTKTLRLLEYDWPVYGAELIDGFLHCGGMKRVMKKFDIHKLPIEEQQMHNLIDAAYEEALGYV